MTLAEDFEDFVKLLNNHNVEYMIVGGYEFITLKTRQNATGFLKDHARNTLCPNSLYV